MSNWAQIFNNCLNIIYKSKCPLCQRSTESQLCKYCQQQIQHCQKSNPSKSWSGKLPVFIWGNYDGALKRAIAALKYENHPEIADLIGEYLAQTWSKNPHSPAFKTNPKLIVVPIPLHASKQKQRGFNQTELIGRRFCNLVGLPLAPQGLVKVRATESQVGKSKTERENNLVGAFALGKPFKEHRPQRSILLLDDVYTTGTTVNYAAETLIKAGISVYGVIAIAAPQISLTKPD